VLKSIAQGGAEMEPEMALESIGGAKEKNLQSKLMILSYNCTRRIGSLVSGVARCHTRVT